jgi:hypothetical protein
MKCIKQNGTKEIKYQKESGKEVTKWSKNQGKGLPSGQGVCL